MPGENRRKGTSGTGADRRSGGPRATLPPADPVLLNLNLERWAGAAEPLVQHLDTLRAEQSELLLLEDMLGVETEGKLDFSLLSTAGPALEVRLFVLPPDYRLTAMPASLLYCKCSSPRHDYLLAVGQQADMEAFRIEVAAQKGRALVLPGWVQGPRDVARGQVRQRQARISEEIEALQRQIASLAEPYHVAESLADISRLEWFMTNVTELPVSENFA